MNKKIFTLGVVMICGLFLGACSLPWSKDLEIDSVINSDLEVSEKTQSLESPILASGNLKKFHDYQEFRNFLVINQKEFINSTQSSIENIEEKGGSLIMNESFLNKVPGVDEADIVKTDGQYVYALVYQDLYIIKVVPVEQTRAVTKLSFPDRPSDIYVDNGKLVVIGSDNQIMKTNVYKNFKRKSPYSFVKIFDVSNPEEPKQVRDLNFEGNYQTSRLIDGRLYLIINNYNQYFAGEVVTPRLVDGGKILPNICADKQACFEPEIYYFDAPYKSFSLTSINTINLSNSNESVSSQAYLLNEAQLIYVAAKNIYITYAQQLNEIDIRALVLRDLLFDRLNESEQKLLLKIETLDNNILSPSEKRQKVLAVLKSFLDSKSSDERDVLDLEVNDVISVKYKEEHSNWEKTIIYRFNLINGAIVYRAQGSVPGIILNKFAINENENSYLRIVTAYSPSLSSLAKDKESSSNIYILDSDLKVSGSLENLIPGELVNLVQFIGNRVYLSKLKEVDSIFAVDLTNYKLPKMLGILNIPQVYTYLYPYDNNTLITINKDVEKDVYGNLVNRGIKLSLLDVDNPSAPKELDKYVLGENGSYSLAMDNQKSLLFSKDKNLLVIPASLTNASNSYRPYFSGSLVLSINDKKFNLRGQIDHSDGGRYQKSDFWCGYHCYDNSVQRSFYIQDNLYTFSNKYLKVNSLNDLNAVQSVKLISDTDIDLNIEPLGAKDVVNKPSEETESGELIGPSLPLDLPIDSTESSIFDGDTSNNGIIIPGDNRDGDLDNLSI